MSEQRLPSTEKDRSGFSIPRIDVQPACAVNWRVPTNIRLSGAEIMVDKPYGNDNEDVTIEVYSSMVTIVEDDDDWDLWNIP